MIKPARVMQAPDLLTLTPRKTGIAALTLIMPPA
jgi:hypothetical protein